MSQSDWVGDLPAKAAFKDIRNTRPSIAEQKSWLCLDIGRLVQKPPPCVINGGVKRVREWRMAADAAQKVAGKARASVTELTLALKALESFVNAPAQPEQQ